MARRVDDGYAAEYYLGFLDTVGFTGPDLSMWNNNRYLMRNVERKPALHKDFEPIETHAYIVQIAGSIRSNRLSRDPSDLP